MPEQPTVEERVALYLAANDHLCNVDQADPEYREQWWKSRDPKFRADYLAHARRVIAIVEPAHAHQLAEDIRAAWKAHDPKKPGNITMLSALNAADFIDPKDTP